MSEHEHKSCALNLDVACCICQPHGCHLSSPQQQPEEPIGANLDQTGEEFIERISKLPAQEQPEDEKCEHKNKTATRCDEDCCCNLLHILCDDCNEITATIPADFQTFPPFPAPQQAEQWMVGLEELVRKWSYDEMTSTDVLIARLKSFINSKIEAAKQDIGKKSEYELARKVWSIVAYKDSDKNLVALLLPILEAGRAASITNHN